MRRIIERATFYDSHDPTACVSTTKATFSLLTLRRGLCILNRRPLASPVIAENTSHVIGDRVSHCNQANINPGHQPRMRLAFARATLYHSRQHGARNAYNEKEGRDYEKRDCRREWAIQSRHHHSKSIFFDIAFGNASCLVQSQSITFSAPHRSNIFFVGNRQSEYQHFRETKS